MLKADAHWCENKRCSDSNPWPMDPKACVLYQLHYSAPRQCSYQSSLVAWHRKQVQPLEFRCFLAYKLYMLFHIHIRLKAAIFDILFTLTYKNVCTTSTMFLDLNNGGFLWKFADIVFVSCSVSRRMSRSREVIFKCLGLVSSQSRDFNISCTSLVSWDPSYIRSLRHYFEFVWAWLIIL